MMALYRAATSLAAPFMPWWLARRAGRGKEDALRVRERLGYASLPRPAGRLTWVHAVSVGEANAALGLIEQLRARYPDMRLLLTTGTVTSARLMETRLPAGVLHQFAPVDTPAAVQRFLTHWQPQLGIWVESELWPNLVTQARSNGCALALVNARMSERSARGWRRAPSLIRSMLSCFSLVAAQSEGDAERFRALGAPHAACLGNLKYDAVPLPAQEAEVAALRAALQDRPLWLAASIHPGEDVWVARAHAELKKILPLLLTIVVPRHPPRGAEMRALFAEYGTVAQRSEKQAITVETDIYLADTLGELGLFYRVSSIACMGGSFIPHGGQNPLEAARLGCAVLAGPHMENFAEMAQSMQREGVLQRVNAEDIARAVAALLNAPDVVQALQQRTLNWAEKQGGATARVMEALAPLLTEGRAHAA